jgi:hypothetical protein
MASCSLEQDSRTRSFIPVSRMLLTPKQPRGRENVFRTMEIHAMKINTKREE